MNPWFRPQVSTTSERAARDETYARAVLYPSPRSCCAMPVSPPPSLVGIAQDARDPEEEEHDV